MWCIRQDSLNVPSDLARTGAFPGGMPRFGREAGGGMQIRTASAADAEAITDVHIASMREAYRGLFAAEELARIDARDRADRWRDHLAGGSSTTLLAERDGRPTGFVSFGACRDEDISPGPVGEVMAIYVRPDAWGLGIGAALLREALARLGGGGSSEVVLWVIEENRRAVGFYERHGFKPDGSVRLREILGKSTAIVRLRLPL
jgi:ribosomal protein S18 acetylase RimI-like enzyme